MLYITGDTHGDHNRFVKFRRKLFKKKGDVCIVCGDFGFVWDNSPTEKKSLQKLEMLNCRILFIEGTHDNINLLQSFPEDTVFKGKSRKLAKNVWWLQRGEIYDIEDKKVFVLGGGHSADADERIPGMTWWEEELPTCEELEYAQENLKKNGNKVDYIITHQRPSIGIGKTDSRASRANALTDFLWEISRTVEYEHWYFGGDHLDKTISRRMTAVFREIIGPLEKIKETR